MEKAKSYYNFRSGNLLPRGKPGRRYDGSGIQNPVGLMFHGISLYGELGMNAAGQKVAVAVLSVVSNTLLVLLKVIVGIWIGSVSVISEAIHSGVDLLAAIIALFAVRTSGKKPDEDHPFGHGKVENLSGSIEAVLIFLAAGWIIYEAVKKIITPQPLAIPSLGVGVMFISAAVNIWVSRKLFKVGKETDSVALLADAWHLRTDIYTSAGVMAGLGLVVAGEGIFPGTHFDWIDPIAAVAVALLIIRAAYQLTVQSARDLLDVSLPEEEKWIRNELAKQDLPIRGFHHLRTRKAGATRFVDLHIVLDSHMSIQESHRISEQITDKIKERFPGTEVTLHEEPCDGDCPENCVTGCLNGGRKRRTIRRQTTGK
jgi:cation diffusion facilitator family transporter